MIKLYTITIIIIMIKLGATDKLKIEPLGIMHKFGQRARPQGSASFTGWTEGMSKFGQNYFTKQGSLLLQDELNICRGYCDARNIMKQISCTKRSGSGWSRRGIVPPKWWRRLCSPQAHCAHSKYWHTKYKILTTKKRKYTGKYKKGICKLWFIYSILRPSCTTALSLLAFRPNAQLHQCTKCKENTYKNTKYTFKNNSEKYSITLAFNLVPSFASIWIGRPKNTRVYQVTLASECFQRRCVRNWSRFGGLCNVNTNASQDWRRINVIQPCIHIDR